MAQGSDGNNRGRGRGGRGGGGRGGARGQQGGRGRSGNRGGYRGRGRGRGIDYHNLDAIDFVVQQWSDREDNPASSFFGRGVRGRGNPSSKPRSHSGKSTPKSGTSTPRGRGRGGYDASPYRDRGRGGPKLRGDAPLSKLLFQERPFLRPVKFVKSVYTPTLFQNEEEVFQPIVESAGDEEASHIPTAERVARVFSGALPRIEDDEDLEEIDFQDLGKLSQLPDMQVDQGHSTAEERFTGVISKTTMTSVTEELVVTEPVALETPPEESPSTIMAIDGQESSSVAFFIDTDPSSTQVTPIQYDRVADDTIPLGRPSIEDDDEQIVYVAPHPRTGRAQYLLEAGRTPQLSQPTSPELPEPQLHTKHEENITAPIQPSMASVSFNFSPSPRKQPRQAPVFTVGARTKAIVKQKVRVGRAMKRKQLYSGFGAFGAMMSEAQLRGEEHIKDPRWEERRRGDSDIDWGDDDDDIGDKISEISAGIGDMDLDPDLELDANALKSFVRSMSAGGSNQVTMDDVADAERMREEDEANDDESQGSSREDEDEDEDEDGSADEEADAIVNAEEELIISESLDVNLVLKGDEEGEEDDIDDDDEEDDDEDDEDDDMDLTAESNFQARLQRIRANGKGKQRAIDFDSDDDDDDDYDLGKTRAENDEDLIAHIQEMLDENTDILASRNRKERKSFFRAIHDGDFDDVAGINVPKHAKDKVNDLPPELVAQWEKDRQKKAENKRARAQARLELAADPFSSKKGGKKGRKAMLQAAKLDLPNSITNMQTLEIKIRQFIADIGGPRTMSLPPMRKDLRKLVHEMAVAFNMKSKSLGKGDARYTTLTKTTRTGAGVDEAKINRIIRRSGGRGFTGEKGGQGGAKGSMAKMRDGEEVGKAAPKIAESNIGFKMLSAMGWSEGDRIGVSGGLEAPLTAIMKRSKLGLGATK